MQSSSGKAPSQASPSKERKIPPPVEDNMIDPLNRFSEILASMKSDNPGIRSHAVQQLTLLVPVMNYLASAYAHHVHYAARDFPTLPEACSILGINHDPNLGWERSDIDSSSVSPLSPDYDSVIQGLKASKYHTIEKSEASVRVVVE
jgi:hypothetical protein